jgi:fluoride exporter
MIWLVGIGGGFGAAARFLSGKWITKKTGNIFPISTLIINIFGSFILGLLVNLHNSGNIGNEVFYFLGVGFCGAFTTFSTFASETVILINEKRSNGALFYVVCSFFLTCIGAFIGLMV